MDPGEIVAVLIIGLGTWLFYLSRKRAFDRRNACGQEVFGSYGGSLCWLRSLNYPTCAISSTHAELR
jgi:hypothetical protein